MVWVAKLFATHIVSIQKKGFMNFYLLRNIYTPASTIGDLVLKNNIICHTLEDTVRPAGSPKIHGKTAIPSGRYKVSVTMSTRFKRMMPVLEDVPNFTGIRMHGGNDVNDTDGCIIVAKNILNSQTVQGTAEKEITELLLRSSERNWIEIVDTYPNSKN